MRVSQEMVRGKQCFNTFDIASDIMARNKRCDSSCSFHVIFIRILRKSCVDRFHKLIRVEELRLQMLFVSIRFFNLRSLKQNLLVTDKFTKIRFRFCDVESDNFAKSEADSRIRERSVYKSSEENDTRLFVKVIENFYKYKTLSNKHYETF